MKRPTATSKRSPGLYRASTAANQPVHNDTEIIMKASQARDTGSSLEGQIRSLNLSDRSRNEALQAASVAEAIVDVFAWVIAKTVRQTRSKYAKPQYN